MNLLSIAPCLLKPGSTVLCTAVRPVRPWYGFGLDPSEFVGRPATYTKMAKGLALNWAKCRLACKAKSCLSSRACALRGRKMRGPQRVCGKSGMVWVWWARVGGVGWIYQVAQRICSQPAETCCKHYSVRCPVAGIFFCWLRVKGRPYPTKKEKGHWAKEFFAHLHFLAF